LLPLVYINPKTRFCEEAECHSLPHSHIFSDYPFDSRHHGHNKTRCVQGSGCPDSEVPPSLANWTKSALQNQVNPVNISSLPSPKSLPFTGILGGIKGVFPRRTLTNE
jgi:hypothetical protein